MNNQTTKKCTTCQIDKPLAEFYAKKTGKYGRTSQCKCCMNAKNAIYYAENKEEIVAKQSIHYVENREELNAKNAIYYAENKEEINAKQAIYRAEHAEERAIYYAEHAEERAIHYAENKEEKCAKQVIYYAENKEEIAAKNATPEARAKRNEKEAERKATEPLYKLRCNISSLIKNALKNGNFKKTSKTANILGCSYEEFQLHIENQFQPNMTWDNQSNWHVDHFFPISWAINEAQALFLNHYSNLRPLWAVDNKFKSAKAPYTIDKETGEISILLECDKEYILNNIEKLEAFLKEFNDLA